MFRQLYLYYVAYTDILPLCIYTRHNKPDNDIFSIYRKITPL